MAVIEVAHSLLYHLAPKNAKYPYVAFAIVFNAYDLASKTESLFILSKLLINGTKIIY